MRAQTILLFISLLLVSFSVNALRCGNQIVDIGDPEIKVLQYCGNPASVVHTTKEVFNSTTLAPGVKHATGDTIQVDILTYNFGSTNFIYKLIFEDGVLTDIQTNQGYGF